jgi:hypothetical protein
VPFYNRIATFDSVNGSNSFDIIFKKESTSNFKNAKSYPSFYRDNLQILNREYSLYVINSKSTFINISPIFDKYLGMNAQLYLGLSSDSNAKFIFKVRNSSYNFFTQSQQITQVKIPVIVGDDVRIERIYPLNKENIPFYISSPHTSTC